MLGLRSTVVVCMAWLLPLLPRGESSLSKLVPCLNLSTSDFAAWAVSRHRHYADEQAYHQAAANFQLSKLAAEELNADLNDGACYGTTQFSDMMPQNIVAKYFPMPMDPLKGKSGGALAQIPEGPPPAKFDWREQGAVTPVKNQKSCGSCWAESAVSNMESVWFLANKASMKQPVQLSVQQVIECDKRDNACYGGYPKGAYEYAIEHKGLATEEAYPYRVDGHVICLANQTFNETCGDGMCDDPPLTSFCDETCSDNVAKHRPVAIISTWYALPADEASMAAYMAANGPISVGIDASGTLGAFFPWLPLYRGGIANPRRCTSTIDHGVLVVGYGEEKDAKFWTIKNSWGQKWGEAGYFRLVRGVGKCGISLMATSAVASGSRALVHKPSQPALLV